MKVEFLEEPVLEFGGQEHHVDVRQGLMRWGPLDSETVSAPRDIRVGVVGTSKTIEGVSEWIRNIRSGVAAKESDLKELFVRFPGFGGDSTLRSDLLLDDSGLRELSYMKIKRTLGKERDRKTAIRSVADLFLEELTYLHEKEAADVFVCALPPEVLKLRHAMMPDNEDSETGGTGPVRFDLHDYLKARAMDLRCPTQLILPTTYGQKIPPKLAKELDKGDRQLQDEATCAWNFYVALYYKAGGIPWRMKRDPAALTTCFVGVSFYHTLESARVRTSLAQIFDERGAGIIVRGGNAVESRKDRTPHLTEEDAYTLLSGALDVYRKEHRTVPARVVLHKTSKFYPGEEEGFGAAIEERGIEYLDLIHVRSYSGFRLFREGQYPVLRGTLLVPDIDGSTMFLQTRGSIPYYRTYPGMYIPRSLEVEIHQSDESFARLGREILALTKMNWNNTQFDESDPITLRGSRKVGNLLRYISEGSPVQPRYSFYM